MKLACLNIGCGKSILKDTNKREYINVDMLEQTAPNYIRHDLSKYPWPFKADLFDEIYMFHTIEHIRKEEHPSVLLELRRIIKPAGKIAISYPEFSKIAQNWLDNKGGQRDFWEATIYGRGLSEWDQHRALMYTPDFIEMAKNYGLTIYKWTTESKETYNTVVVFQRGEFSKTYEQLMGEEFQMNVSGT